MLSTMPGFTINFDRSKINTSVSAVSNVYNRKDIMDTKDPYKIPDVNNIDRIIDIKILKKNKVVAVYFNHLIKYNIIKCKNGDKAVPVYAMSKAVTREDDMFDMEKGVFIALAKYMFPGLYTPDGYEEIAKQLSFRKDYNKYVKAAIKKASKKREEEKKARAKEIENQKIIARKKEKNKIRKKQRREEQIDIIKEAINKSNASPF